MIKHITTSGNFLVATCSNTSTYVNGYSGAQGVGNMRFNTSTQNIEVFDGNAWISLNMSYATVGLTQEAQSILDWAKKKQYEEQEREQLAKSNLAIKDLVNQIKEKEEQIKMVMTLLKSSGTEGQELMGS